MPYSSSGLRKRGRISRFDSLIEFWADRRGLSLPMLKAQIKQESDFVQWARNASSGARGLMQLTDIAIADIERIRQDKESDLDIYPYMMDHGQIGVDPDLNIAYGSYYFKHRCLAFWPEIPDPVEQVRYALFVYNAGVGHGKMAAQVARKSCGQPAEYSKWVAEGSPEGPWQSWHYFKRYIGHKAASNGKFAKTSECIPYVELIEAQSRKYGGLPF